MVLLIGAHTILVGVRDGMVRGRIRSRWHRDRRELTGNSAVWAGASTTSVGVAVLGLGVWLAVRFL